MNKETMQEKVEKSRELGLGDFYSIIQKEYICYMVRAKIYPEPYCERYKGYLPLKREKIENIARKGCMTSIFLSQQHYEKYLNLVLQPWGLPEFEYRNEESRRMMGFWDRIYWFNKGVSCTIKVGEQELKGVVINNLPLKMKVAVKLSTGEIKVVEYINASRDCTNEFKEIF